MHLALVLTVIVSCMAVSSGLGETGQFADFSGYLRRLQGAPMKKLRLVEALRCLRNGSGDTQVGVQGPGPEPCASSIVRERLFAANSDKGNH